MTQPGEILHETTIREFIANYAGPDRVPVRFKIITDTSDFFRVEYNDVVVLGDVPYWVKRCEKEGRFGLDDEPKFWVRRAVELTTGATRILKLVFHEEFTTVIAGIKMTCFRSPKKEARLLDLVTGHKNFMHGRWALDAAGNNVRILEFIHGPRFDDVVAGYGSDHHDYFQNYFPQVLHDHGEKHGDIRRDHIIWDEETQANRWIDFDYNFQQGESLFSFDLQGLGNILIFLAGRGDVLVPDLYHKQKALFDTLWGEDLSIAYKNRVANLKKIYPYIPESLNRILLHFSQGTNFFYETTGQMLEDLATARADVISLTGRQS